jgi:hypothetical protein
MTKISKKLILKAIEYRDKPKPYSFTRISKMKDFKNFTEQELHDQVNDYKLKGGVSIPVAKPKSSAKGNLKKNNLKIKNINFKLYLINFF